MAADRTPLAQALAARPSACGSALGAILYVVRSGCQGRRLPRNFPDGSTVDGVFRRWRLAGLWQKINDALREQVRRAEGKKATPAATILDHQSVRTAEGGKERDYDAGKRSPAASGASRWTRWD